MARSRSNPLALAILCSLQIRPRHPYDIAAWLKLTHKHDSIKLNYGSLYSVVERLERSGLIAAQETVRQGRRPERTIYAITDAGLAEIDEWLADLLRTPCKEYTRFEAALSLLASMHPDDVVALLTTRQAALEVELEALGYYQQFFTANQIPRLFTIEHEYTQRLLRAELEFVRDLIGEIGAGTFADLDFWREISDPGSELAIEWDRALMRQNSDGSPNTDPDPALPPKTMTKAPAPLKTTRATSSSEKSGKGK